MNTENKNDWVEAVSEDKICADPESVPDTWGKVENPDTREVFEALRSAERIEHFSQEYGGCFIDVTFKDYLNKLLNSCRLKKSEVIRVAGFNHAFGFQIFRGEKKPSRNKLLALAFAMQVTVRECQRLLWLGGVNELYSKNRRDAVIIFGLERKLNIEQTNDILYDMKEATL